jgi:HK97 family phage prohead protease
MNEHLKFVTIEDFRKLADSPDAKEVAIRSESIEEVEAKSDATETRILTFTISSSAVDRDRDMVSTHGWDLAGYTKNPVVLWAHNYRQIPVARARKVWVEDGSKLKAEDEFTPKGVDAFNDTVFELYRMRFMRATSVGFRPLKWNWNEERKGGIDFLEQELLEHSFVPVPANPDALMDAKSAGIDTEPLKKWAENVILACKTVDVTPQVEILAGIDPKSLADDIITEIRKILHPTPPPVAAEKTLPLLEVVRRQIVIARLRV